MKAPIFHIHSVFTFFLPAMVCAQGMLDQPAIELAWEARRDLSESTYDAKLEEMRNKGYRLTDVEVLGGGARIYAGIWRKNVDNRNWEVNTRLSDRAFAEKWETLKNKGYRPVDQEFHALNGMPYYGAIWVENKENLKWASFRKLTAAGFSEKQAEYKDRYMPVDLDVYEIGGQQLYSLVWLENKDNLKWAIQRDIARGKLPEQVKAFSDKGFRLYKIEMYEQNGAARYAAIWVENTEKRYWQARYDLDENRFRNWRQRFRDRGYRLESLEMYRSQGKILYAGIWLENDERVRWPLSDQVDKTVQGYILKEPVAGISCAIAVNGKIHFTRGWGFQDIASKKEAHANTIFRHASIAKALCSVMAFRLHAQGKIDLSNRTRSYEPRLPPHHTHTVGQLLSCRGGVRHYKQGHDPLKAGTAEIYTNAFDATRLFSADSLIPIPYLYSTHGYTCAAAAMEKATGLSYSAILDQQLAKPFDLGSLRCENLNQLPEERSKIYRYGPSGFVEIIPESLSWKYAGGGTESSVYDLARFGIQLLEGKVLSKAALTTMTTPPDAFDEYAFGWDTGKQRGQTYFCKSGGQPGARSFIICYPVKKVVVALLSNTAGDGIVDLGKQIGGLLIGE